jgi:hypothetical protein
MTCDITFLQRRKWITWRASEASSMRMSWRLRALASSFPGGPGFFGKLRRSRTGVDHAFHRPLLLFE